MERKRELSEDRQMTWSRTAYVSIVGEVYGGGSEVISQYVSVCDEF